MNITPQSCFDEAGQNEPWRNALAAELNELLARAEYETDGPHDESDERFAKAACSIALRVAVFEEIELVKSK